jgi:hypothetical protein
VLRRLPLERDGCSLEGCRGWLFVGPLRFLGHGPFFALGRSHAGCDLRLAVLIVHFYYF